MSTTKKGAKSTNAKNASVVKNSVAIEKSNKVPTFETMSKSQKTDYNKLVSEFRTNVKAETFTVSQWTKYLVAEILPNNEMLKNIISLRFGLSDLSDTDGLKKTLLSACLKGFKLYAEDKTTILQLKHSTVWTSEMDYTKTVWYEVKTIFSLNEVITSIFKPAKDVQYIKEYSTKIVTYHKATVTSGKVSETAKVTTKKTTKK